jgi:hypothetical protein
MSPLSDDPSASPCDAQKLEPPGFPDDQLTDHRGFLHTEDGKFTLDTGTLRHDNRPR